MPASEFEEGILVGLLLGEGHFGGDGRQPQVTLRMNVRHESLFRWILRKFPGGRLYGPYHHGGRHYFQWMARGDFLRTVLVPILERGLQEDLDLPAYLRFEEMARRYRLVHTSPERHPAVDERALEPESERRIPSINEDRLSELFAQLRGRNPLPE